MARRKHLEARLPPVYLETRVKESDCRRCGRMIYTGHLWGEPVRIDRTPLTRLGELAALTKGHRTFQQDYGGGIYRRTAFHISQPVPRYSLVMADHTVCGTVWAATHINLQPRFPRQAAVCPF